MGRSTMYTLRKIGIDAVCLLALGLGILYFQKLAPVYKRGFFCDDESIKHPYKDNTISSNLLYLFSFGIPGLLIIIGEFLYARTTKRTELFGHEIPSWMLMAYSKLGLFAFGALVTVLIVDTGKYNIGRLRPHFIEACRPNISCDNTRNSFEFQHKYHEYFSCTNNKTDDYEHRWKDARLSFPSGHSAYAMYGMIFFALYLQLRMTWKGSKLLRHLLQGMCLWLAWFTAMSRISDYKHHWSDVLAGMLLGSIVALVNVFCVADLFKERRVENGGTTMFGKIRGIESDIEPSMQVNNH